MLERASVGLICVLAVCAPAVARQAGFSSAQVSGVPSGSGTGPGGTLTFSGNSFNNYVATGGSGGTSGGLGDGVVTVAVANSTISMSVGGGALTRGGGGGTTLNFHMQAGAQWNPNISGNYSGSISAALQVDFFIDITGEHPVAYSLTKTSAYAPGWPGGTSPSSFVAYANGALIDGNLLWPGRYRLVMDAYSGVAFGPFGSSFRIGDITLTITSVSPTIDGTRDAVYVTPYATQGNLTGFGEVLSAATAKGCDVV